MANTKTLDMLVGDLFVKLGGSVRYETFAPLAKAAVGMAIDHAGDYDEREFVQQDLVGIPVVNPWDSMRFALTGREVLMLPVTEQYTPVGMTATYDDYTYYRPQPDNLEYGVDADGTLNPLVTTLTFLVPIAPARKVRVKFYRHCMLPASETTIIQLEDSYLERASKMYMHELLSARQLGGDPANHAFQRGEIAKDLLRLMRNRNTVRVNFQSWRGQDGYGRDLYNRTARDRYIA